MDQGGGVVWRTQDAHNYLYARDTTFTTAGQIGLWTKADAATHFDDLEVRVLGRSFDA